MKTSLWASLDHIDIVIRMLNVFEKYQGAINNNGLSIYLKMNAWLNWNVVLDDSIFKKWLKILVSRLEMNNLECHVQLLFLQKIKWAMCDASDDLK